MLCCHEGNNHKNAKMETALGYLVALVCMSANIKTAMSILDRYLNYLELLGQIPSLHFQLDMPFAPH